MKISQYSKFLPPPPLKKNTQEKKDLLINDNVFLWRNIGSSNITHRLLMTSPKGVSWTGSKVIWSSLWSFEWKKYNLCLLYTVLMEKYGKFLFLSKKFRIIKVNHVSVHQLPGCPSKFFLRPELQTCSWHKDCLWPVNIFLTWA